MLTKSEIIREIANYIRQSVGEITHVEIGIGSRVMRLDIGDIDED